MFATDSFYTCSVPVFPVYRLACYGYIFIIPQNYVSRIGSVIISIPRNLFRIYAREIVVEVALMLTSNLICI